MGDTQWHPDATEFVTGGRIKVALYLDPVTRETGCLRFIPGSHRQPLHGELGILRIARMKQNIADGVLDPGILDLYREQGIDVDQLVFGVQPEDLPAYAAESQPGDVVLFDQHLYHGSFGGHVGRRMFTLNYYTAPQTAEAVAVFQREWSAVGDRLQAGCTRTPCFGATDRGCNDWWRRCTSGAGRTWPSDRPPSRRCRGWARC